MTKRFVLSLAFCAVLAISFGGPATAQSQDVDLNSAVADLKISAAEKALLQRSISLQVQNARLDAQEKQRIQDETNQFKGFGPGVGVSVSFYGDDSAPIQSAEVVNGIVRITDESKITTSIMFETHYFFTKGEDELWGYGPYAGVLSSTENVIDAFGIGGMVGRRKIGESQSFNLGLGVVIDPKVQVLGDGITADKPLPPGETTVRFKTKSAWGFHVMASFQF